MKTGTFLLIITIIFFIAMMKSRSIYEKNRAFISESPQLSGTVIVDKNRLFDIAYSFSLYDGHDINQVDVYSVDWHKYNLGDTIKKITY